MSGLSIGFRVPEGGASFKEDEFRRIREIELWEVSLVTFPANRDARVTSVKNLDGQKLSGPDDVRAMFRYFNVPHRAATKMAAGAWGEFVGRSVDEIEADLRAAETKETETQQLSEALSLLRQFGTGGSK